MGSFLLNPFPSSLVKKCKQSPAGSPPAAYLNEIAHCSVDQIQDQIRISHSLGFNLAKPLDRVQVRAICGNPNIDVLCAYAVAMAWGGQRRNHFRSSLGSPHLRCLLDDLRTSKRSRADDFDRCKAAAVNIKGLGISFYTKLLYFFRPTPDACILDQWIVKSLAVILKHSPITRTSWGGPDPKTYGHQYEAASQAIEQIGQHLGGWSGEEAESALFDTPRGRWRLYVDSLLTGS